MDTIKSNEFATTFQLHVDALAWDLIHNQSSLAVLTPGEIADLLDLCPGQNVWMYEPVPEDESEDVRATFRLVASDGTTFHMACRLTSDSEIKEWIGPHDIILPVRDLDTTRHSMAA